MIPNVMYELSNDSYSVSQLSGDKTSIYTMLRTNKGYRGLTHPMREVEIDGVKKYLPNFKYRYFTEDIPMGLVVTRGIAELAAVPTPNMDTVIMWCQEMLGKEYLVDGKLVGKDIHSTRAPQHYGFTDLDTFMDVNHYLEDDNRKTSSIDDVEETLGSPEMTAQ